MGLGLLAAHRREAHARDHRAALRAADAHVRGVQTLERARQLRARQRKQGGRWRREARVEIAEPGAEVLEGHGAPNQQADAFLHGRAVHPRAGGDFPQEIEHLCDLRRGEVHVEVAPMKLQPNPRQAGSEGQLVPCQRAPEDRQEQRHDSRLQGRD